jgi:hypothetical protein
MAMSRRTLAAKAAAHASWARTEDRRARTEPARKARLDKLADQIDPGHTLPEEERLRRAENKRKSQLYSMSLKAARVRELRRQAAQMDVEIAAEDPEMVAEAEQLLDEGGAA